MSRKFILTLLLITGLYRDQLHAQKSINNSAKTETIIALWNSNGDQYGMYPVAIWEKMFESEYEKALKENNEVLIFKTRLALSSIYHDQSKFTKAFPFLKFIYANKLQLKENEYKTVLIKLEEEYRSFGDIANALIIRDERIKKGYIDTYWEIYRDCGLFEAAKKDFIQFQKKGSPASWKELNYYFYLGEIYFELNQVDSAQIVYKLGVQATLNTIDLNKKTKVYREANLHYFYGYFLGNIAKCYIYNGQYKKAIPLLLEDIKNSYENIENKARKIFYLSNCYLKTNDIGKAKLYLDSGIQIFNGKTNSDIYLIQLKSLSNYYNFQKAYDSAYFYSMAYVNFKDSIDKKKQNNQSVLLLAQLELSNRRSELIKSGHLLEEKNKIIKLQKLQLFTLVSVMVFATAFIIALYRNYRQKNKNEKFIEKQNYQLKISSESIKKQNDKNEILLKELHHRVKNNLQVMYSLLNLQKRRNKDADTKSSLLSIQNRIQTMALVHQNLYTTGNFEMVEVVSYIKTLITHLISIYQTESKEIEIIYDIETDLQLPIENVVSMGLILNEAVSNALKYAFTKIKQGKLHVVIYSNAENCIIEVKDNGPGFNNQDLKENSLGMKLIKVMCAQLKANYVFENTNGVSHNITFKK